MALASETSEQAATKDSSNNNKSTLSKCSNLNAANSDASNGTKNNDHQATGIGNAPGPMNDAQRPPGSKRGASHVQNRSTATPPVRKMENLNEPAICNGCGKQILDRFLLEALEAYWHEDCLKCACCQCRLGEVGATLYVKQGMTLCRRDYLRLFGATGVCAACSETIPAFEMVMRARHKVYHLNCFACQECGHRFCVGDTFYLWGGKILCGYDYEERKMFAQMAQHWPSPAHLQQLRDTISKVDDLDQAPAAAMHTR